MTEVFLDTNVLVYAYDQAEQDKQVRAQAVLLANPTAVISTQVLLEWFSVATRRLAHPLPAQVALTELDKMTRLVVVPTDAELVTRAARTSVDAQISLWDAMIVEAAVLAGCGKVLSEDLGAGQVIRGVRIENPFI